MTKDDFELEQYGALRAEILRAMEDSNQVMNFGLATIGIVLNAGVGVRDTLFGFIVFAVLIPGLSGLVLSMWFAAHERVGRASYYLTGVEFRLKQSLKVQDTPSWECWLRKTSKGMSIRHHFWSTEYSGIGILIFMMLVPLYLSFAAGGEVINLTTKIYVVGAGTIAVGLFAFSLKWRIARWKHWLCTTYSDDN